MAIYLSLGSNLGDRLKHILDALGELNIFGRVVAVSDLYETAPIGMGGENFYNCVVKYRTNLSPFEFLRILKMIEHDLGRDESQGHNRPRVIDIDILIYHNYRIESEQLTIPHPAIYVRDFVLRGLLDIDENFFCRFVGKSASEILGALKERSILKRIMRGEELFELLFTG